MDTKKVKKIFVQYLPTIMAFTAVIGVGVTAWLSGEEIPKAKLKLDEIKENNFGKVDLKGALDVTKEVAPALAVGLTTAGLILGGDAIHRKRYFALLGRCELITKKAMEWKRATKEVLGKSGEAAAVAILAKETDIPDLSENLGETDDGEKILWFFDVYSKSWFKCTWKKLFFGIGEFEDYYHNNGYVPLALYYDILNKIRIDDAVFNTNDCDRLLGWDVEQLSDECECYVGVPFEYDEFTDPKTGLKGQGIWFSVDPMNCEDYLDFDFSYPRE